MELNNRRILVIAGSDSSGGAGLEADQKVIATHSCYAMTATTALTVQNTKGVIDVQTTTPSFVEKQIHACIDDIGVDAVKIGMLACTETIDVVAKALRTHAVSNVILDPVMVSTSGARLLQQNAVQTLVKELLPLTTVLTPNLPEALLILKASGSDAEEPQDMDAFVKIAAALQRLGPAYVLLKGGHFSRQSAQHSESVLARNDIVDVLYGQGHNIIMKNERLYSNNTHGTGCSLASAIACHLVLGKDIANAVQNANAYIWGGISTSQKLGAGRGPINHFHSTYMLPFLPGRFIDYLLHRADVRGPWYQSTNHEFLSQLADGSLPTACFQNYLIQDYLFLIQLARANALAAYKSKDAEDMATSASMIFKAQKETKMHLEYCKGFGLSKEDIESNEESEACTAYTRYILDVGHSEDWLALQMTMAPCFIGYQVIAQRLYNDPQTLRKDNPYWQWILSYVDEDYIKTVDTCKALIEKHAVNSSPHRIEELVKIFIHATKMERGFWNMGRRHEPDDH